MNISRPCKCGFEPHTTESCYQTDCKGYKERELRCAILEFNNEFSKLQHKYDKRVRKLLNLNKRG